MAAYWRKTWPFHLLLLPALALVIVFQYIPLFGVVIAFQDYEPWLGIKGSPWVGFEHFQYLFTYPDGKQVIWNTLIISAFKLIINLIIPIVFALLLNEVRKTLFKRAVQTFVYLPHFLSWVILGGIMLDILSPEGGIVNRLLNAFGIDSIFFLGNGSWFRFTVVLSDVWKEFGFSAIIFLATLVGINPALYEAAEIDGASRWQQVISISIPLIMPIVIVVATLSLGRILDAGFDQILNLYNPLVYSHGDIIDTFVYREGLNNGQFSFGTAVGLFKSFIGFILIVISYRLAFKLANYRIF
ncbi:putative aldouronate transport system permease protein [Paenibacillus cellulosilyticus]|uniref:Putative aldouronate transport system permease protein n=1 Tax=Paenibacillus cellulosilyticus TaxID=375489 RepID=A0A2V2YPT1_9BACL|nr:ABC transporter permease subunit [Paenibacillus cellulosilyticus]PWV98499.1 putative aldouronate transport system permease protein [Paenibacillus cellulosilyticus]QKS44108.1 sugar ABC transporter permease [Paenibacillus cellulosilyticus]